MDPNYDLESWLNNETIIIDNYLNNNNLSLETEFDPDIGLNNKWKKLKYNIYGNSKKYYIKPTNNILNFKIKLNKSENLNEFLNSSIMININSELNCYSLRLLALLAEKIFNFKIIENYKYFVIPILIFQNIKDNKSFSIQIYNNFNYKLLCNSHPKNKSIFLQIKFGISNICDNIQKYPLWIDKYTMGIIIWHILSNENIDLINPDILKAEITFYHNNIKFSKNIDFEKIEFNGKTGYFISVNKLNFNQLLNYCKVGNFDILNDLITWDNDIKFFLIEIHWSTHYENNYCVIEILNFNY
jgi:hypothetical protein